MNKILKAAHKSLGRGVKILFHDGRVMPARLTGISYQPDETLIVFTDYQGFFDHANILEIKGIEKNE